MSDTDLANVVGAPRNSTVSFANDAGDLNFSVSHPDIEGYSGTISKRAAGTHIKIGYMRTRTSEALGTRMGLGILANAKKYGVRTMSTTGAGSGAELAANTAAGVRGWTGYSTWANLGGLRKIEAPLQDKLRTQYNMEAKDTHELLTKYGREGMKAWKKIGTSGKYSWDLRENSRHVAVMRSYLDRLGRRVATSDD